MKRHAPLRRPTISLLCPTAHPAALVVAVIGAVREHVDEVVIAADARVEPAELAALSTVADVLLRYEHAGANRHWPWLAAQARGDWLLLLDGDELIGEDLAQALPDLVTDRRVSQFSLPIRWAWPDPGRFLTSEPWSSDRRLRLLRNEPRLTFGARKHVLANPTGPIRYLDELPVYHLDLLLTDERARRAKVERYDSELFGMLTAEGVPFNAAFYLPEAGLGPRDTAATPAVDVERMAAALEAAAPAVAPLDPADVPAVAGRDEIAWHAPRVELPADDHRAALRFTRDLPAFVAGAASEVWVEVENQGTALWPGGEEAEPRVRLGVTWSAPDGSEPRDGGRAFLPHALAPGERALVPVVLVAPPQAGPAQLAIDLLHEDVRWFGAAVTAAVTVQPGPRERLAALGGEVLPLAAVLAERRAVSRRDGLLVSGDAPSRPPADPRVAALVAELALGGWALDGETIDRLAQLVLERRPAAVAEFGSGTSTVVLARLAADAGGRGHVVSFEQDPGWAARTRAALEERGLSEHATVAVLPVGQPDPTRPMGYVLTDEGAALLAAHPPELVLVDGPTLASGASRLTTIDLVTPYLREDATLLLDDALRDAELRIAEAWERRRDVTVLGIRPTPKGLLEGALHAATTTPDEADAAAQPGRFARLLRRR
jgi:predicted O-methyltransferase YrrM